MTRILYTSEQVRRAIHDLFLRSRGRRVAIAAFVGRDAEAYLPRRKGIELYCWPHPTGTNPRAIESLRRQRVAVFFADRVHMKLYWAAGQGAVLTSANLSTNAFGAGSLKEIGVRLRADQIDIERVIKQIEAVPVTDARLAKLREAVRRTRPPRLPPRGKRRTFLDWAKVGSPRWKVMAYGSDAPIPRSLKEKAREIHAAGRRELYRVFFFERKGQVREHEFVLNVSRKTHRFANPHWVFVHCWVRVPKTERGYLRGEPFSAGQTHPLRACPPVPFDIDRNFRNALRAVAQELGPKAVEERFAGIVSGRKLAVLRRLLLKHCARAR